MFGQMMGGIGGMQGRPQQGGMQGGMMGGMRPPARPQMGQMGGMNQGMRPQIFMHPDARAGQMNQSQRGIGPGNSFQGGGIRAGMMGGGGFIDRTNAGAPFNPMGQGPMVTTPERNQGMGPSGDLMQRLLQMQQRPQPSMHVMPYRSPQDQSVF